MLSNKDVQHILKLKTSMFVWRWKIFPCGGGLFLPPLFSGYLWTIVANVTFLSGCRHKTLSLYFIQAAKNISQKKLTLKRKAKYGKGVTPYSANILDQKIIFLYINRILSLFGSIFRPFWLICFGKFGLRVDIAMIRPESDKYGLVGLFTKMLFSSSR